MARLASCHYLNQCWNIVNLNLRNTLQWNRKQNLYIFIQENAFKNELNHVTKRDRWSCFSFAQTCLLMELEYFVRTTSTTCLATDALAPWFTKSSVWYWLCGRNGSLSSTRMYFNYLSHINFNLGIIEEFRCKYIFIFSKINLTSQGLTWTKLICQTDAYQAFVASIL